MRERSKGHWQLRAPAGNDPVTGKPRLVERTVQARNKSEAQAELAKLVAELAAKPQTGSSATVRVVCEEWLRHKAGRSDEPVTLHTDAQCIDKVIAPELGDVPVRDLTSRHIDEWINHLLTGEGRKFATEEDELKATRGGRVPKLKPSSALRQYAVLKAALGQAVDWGWLDKNPCGRRQAPSVPERDAASPTVEQVSALLELAFTKNLRWGMLLVLALVTGARRGEVCALRWRDVEPFENGGETWAILHFHDSTWRAGKDSGVKSSLKGGRSKPGTIDPVAVRRLEWWRQQCEDEALNAGVSLVPDAFIVSPFPDGSRPVNPDSFGSAIKRWCGDLGMPDIHLHSQRHHASSTLLREGIDVRNVAEILGHQDGGRLLLRTYAHGDSATKRDAARILGRPLVQLTQ